jgi:uncharacterized membrane protein
MKQRRKNIHLIQQRISFLLVFVFCLLTSGLEYLPLEEKVGKSTAEIATAEKDTTSNETYLSVSVDAVVPFALALSQHVYHVIYELLFPEKSIFSTIVVSVAKNLHFREILLEHFISKNAP